MKYVTKSTDKPIACVMFVAKFTSCNGLRYHKIRYKMRGNNPIRPFQLCTGSLWYILKFSDIYNIGIMPGGDHCAVWGCDNDRRYPEKQKVLPHVGILRFYSPKNKKDVLSWARAINRDQFKVTTSTKVCSNHFVQGYRTSQCPTLTLYMKGYDCDSKPQRPAPKFRSTENKERNTAKRKRSYSADQGPSGNLPLEDDSLLGENFDFEYPASLSHASTADSTVGGSKTEVATQTEYRSPEKEKRDYFIDQATCPKNCYRYTGVTMSKLDLLFDFFGTKGH